VVPTADALDEVTQLLAVLGRVHQRTPGVELYRDERIRQLRQIDRGDRGCSVVLGVIEHRLQRVVAQPELAKQLEHGRRM